MSEVGARARDDPSLIVQIIATAVSFVAGAAGYLMIGNSVSDEVSPGLCPWLSPRIALSPVREHSRRVSSKSCTDMDSDHA
jgi:hypothetical protein